MTTREFVLFWRCTIASGKKWMEDSQFLNFSISQEGVRRLQDAWRLTDALEFGLEGFLVVAVGDVEEEVRILALQKLRGRDGSANAQHARRAFGSGLAPGQRRYLAA